MVNFNGKLIPRTENSLQDNRAFLYGDGVFETVKVLEGRILFLEDHYFRLMAAMRIVRMRIPMDFTMEYFETQILLTVEANHCENSARARITVYRNSGGFYFPETSSVSFIADASALGNALYNFRNKRYEVDLYKDFYISKQLLSTLKTTNKMINIVGSIYANENELNDCLLLNDEKNVAEALQGNVFILSENKLATPPLTDGCLNGIMRKQILALAKSIDGLEVAEESISPFDLQKADELFVTNVITGIQPISKYRKKDYRTNLSEKLLTKLNELLIS